MIFLPGFRARALPIEPAAWVALVDRFAFLAGLDESDALRMRTLIAEFLSSRTLTGAEGLEVDDPMRLAIAAQACLPVLRLGLGAYDKFTEIVLYPTAFEVRRRFTDDDGLVHEFDDVLVGEAMDGGPVVLSWDDSNGRGVETDSNVVIHEFVHKLDLADGVADGCPQLPAARRAAWRRVLDDAYDRFVEQVDDLEASIPVDVDPESTAADAWYATLPLDPYAATDTSEFFAVAAECFFVAPARLQQAFPDLHRQFVAYFQQDPLERGSFHDPRAPGGGP
jgi:Mlc titration factor MtfA (ptsG expression regulator)